MAENKIIEGAPVSGDVYIPETPVEYDSRSVYEVDPTLSYNADPDFQRFYKQILAGMSPQTIDYTPLTAQEIAAQISEYLRPSTDQQIRNRQLASRTQRAQTDADAASRGILSSTWVTDIKNRLMQNESADIAAIESDYRSQLLQGVYNRQAQEADRAYQIAMFNAQMRQQAEADAYKRAGDMYNLYLQQKKKKKSGGGKPADTPGDDKNTDLANDPDYKLWLLLKEGAESFVQNPKKPDLIGPKSRPSLYPAVGLR